MTTNKDESCGCSDCALGGADRRATRRAFLQATGLGAVVLLASSTAAAAALPIVTIDPIDPTQADAERRYPIPASDSINVDRASQLILARYAGHVYVFSLSCPHQNNAVKWVQQAHQFQCTKHDSHYQPDGVHISGRATRNMDRYVIRRDGDSVVVDLHKWVQSDKDPSGWAAASIAV